MQLLREVFAAQKDNEEKVLIVADTDSVCHLIMLLCII